jgi:tetratricopeptide (TPR) repeat protein
MKLALNIIFLSLVFSLSACQTPPKVAAKSAQDAQETPPQVTKPSQPAQATDTKSLQIFTTDEIKVFTRNYDQEVWRSVVEQAAAWDRNSFSPDMQVMLAIAEVKSASVNDDEKVVMLIALRKRFPDSLAVLYAVSRAIRFTNRVTADEGLKLVAAGPAANTRLDKQVRAYALLTNADKPAFKEGMLQILKLYEDGDRAPWTLYFYGAGLALLEQYAEAVPLLKLAITIKPDHMDSHIALTSALNDLGLYQESMSFNKAALKLESRDSDRIQLLNNLGASHMDLQQWRDAEVVLTESIQRSAGFIMGRINLAETQMQLGKRDEAILNAQKVVTSAPTFSYGWAVMAWCYEKMGQTKQRDAALAKLRALEPDEAAKLIKVRFNMNRYRHDK